MDGTTLSGGVAWAVPVRPDLLGQALEAYDKVLPTLTALRLCHQFGAGPEAHIAKLPKEIELLIEQKIFDRKAARMWRSGGHLWLSNFRHYEYRCEPMEHVYDSDVLYDIADDLDRTGLCEKCVSGETMLLDCDDCQEIVEARLNAHMDATAPDYAYELCQEEREAWRELIDQGQGGTFAKYDKVSCSTTSTTKLY